MFAYKVDSELVGCDSPETEEPESDSVIWAAVLGHTVCGGFLQQPQEMNIAAKCLV